MILEFSIIAATSCLLVALAIKYLRASHKKQKQLSEKSKHLKSWLLNLKAVYFWEDEQFIFVFDNQLNVVGQFLKFKHLNKHKSLKWTTSLHPPPKQLIWQGKLIFTLEDLKRNLVEKPKANNPQEV